MMVADNKQIASVGVIGIYHLSFVSSFAMTKQSERICSMVADSKQIASVGLIGIYHLSFVSSFAMTIQSEVSLRLSAVAGGLNAKRHCED
jgi:membrane protein YqaA with SNARE-associated domain